MSDLSEHEILSCMRENFGAAASDLDLLARGYRGQLYERVRAELGLIEGCCRQTAAWREDTRWIPVGQKIADLVEFIRKWIVQHAPAEYFSAMADVLRGYERICRDLETKAVGKLGIVLPEVRPDPTIRQGRPVQVLTPKRPSGLILPPGYVHAAGRA